MTKLLEIRERISKFCGEYEVYLKFVYKFIIALALFSLINETVGFMESINTFSIALLLALICCLFPQGVTIFVASVLVVLHLYTLSIEVAITALLIFALVFFLYFRFSPKDGVLFALTPICFVLRIPYVLPIGTGLLRKTYSTAAVACGTIVFFFLDGIYQNVTALQATKVGGAVEAAKMSITIGQLLANKEMYLTVGVFVISAIVVYLVRKMSIDHAWKVAIVSGALVQISGLFVGYLLLDITGKTVNMIIGNLIAIILGLVIEFIFMDLDYSRTERVQFEDDDYYYFVKAIPKKMVASADKEVIQFSSSTSRDKAKDKNNYNNNNSYKNNKKNKKGEKPVSRKQVVRELEIDEEFL